MFRSAYDCELPLLIIPRSPHTSRENIHSSIEIWLMFTNGKQMTHAGEIKGFWRVTRVHQ